jgi:Spy/CpxP family protein refolding chaperone
MKLNRRSGMLLAVLASIGMGTAVTGFAQTASPDTSAAPSGTEHHGAATATHGQMVIVRSMLLNTTLRATRQLNLTAAQKSQIKTILQTAHTQERTDTQAASHPDMAVLGDPSNPGYSAAIQSLKTNATNRIQMESDVQGQIVNVLTPEQKAKLPGVLASIQAKQEAHRTAAASEHTGSMR